MRGWRRFGWPPRRENGGGQEAAPETSSAPSSPASSSASTSGILSFDATAKTVNLKIVAGAGRGFNFNGFSNGAMTITVPAGWAVTVSCTNEAPAPHSCAVVAPGSSAPAFANSATPNPTVGLAQGQSQSFTFTPDKPGTFRLACLVAGHEDAGMWDAFTVAAGGQPSISPP